MAKQRKHSNSKASDFFDYLGGKLSGKERNAFERRLQKDPFEAEAAEGLAMVTRAEMEEDLHAASARIRRRIRRNHRIAWYSAAAAVASLMIVATIFFNVDDGGMDRYKTAPEFEEAVQEQPSASGVEKKRTRKDAIEEAEEVHEGLMLDKEMVQDEDKVQEELRQEELRQEELRQEEFTEKMAEALSVPGVAKDVTDRQVAAEEKMNIMEVTDDKYIAAARNENVAAAARNEKIAAAAEMNTDENAAERKAISKKAAAERTPEEIATGEKAISEKAAGERAPEEVRAAGERAPEEVRAAGEKVDDEIVFVERAADATERRKRAGPESKDVPTAQKVRQDEIPDMEELQSFQVHALEEELDQVQDVDVSVPLQGQVQDVDVSVPLQDQVQNVDVSVPQGQLSGIVYSAENLEPLPGVILFVKGTTTGTVSGDDGSFSLNTGTESGSTLVANFIGMQSEEIPIEAGRSLEIAMVPDHLQLDEVVVVGHAVSKKTSMTSAVSRVETDPLTQNEYITASPVDGITAYREYIDTTLVNPPETGSADKEVVVLRFSVTPNGRPENFRVIRSPGEVYSKEAIRVISEGPDWKPTSSNGNFVDDKVRLRVVFQRDK